VKKNILSDPYLVIEQNGLRVLVIGLLIALITAMTFRAIFSPQRIKYEIERVIEEANPQKIELKVEKAYLSLADGWIPRLAVVIENLEVRSQEPCLYYARINAGIMVLPVSLQSIFDRSLVLKKLEVDNLVVHLKTKGVQCESLSVSSAAEGTVSNSRGESSLTEKVTENAVGETGSTQDVKNLQELPAAQTATKVLTAVQAAPIIQTLSIEGSPLKEVLLTHGELHFDSFPSFYLQFKKIKAELVNQPARSALLDGNIELIPVSPEDRLIGWNAHFQMQIDEQVVKSHFKGQWREGSINLDLNYKSKENQIDLAGDFKQIPLGQIFIFTNEMGWSKSAPSARQSWISFHTEFNQNSKKDKHLSIKEVRVEGDFGDIKVPAIEASGEPLTWQPLRVELNSVHLSKLFTAFDQPHPSGSLSSLGVFNGIMDLEGLHFKGAQGELKGLEFVFSNKGIRDVQEVSTMQVDVIESDNQQYKGKVSNLELKGGDFKGQIEGVFNKTEESTQIQVVLDQIKFNSKVEKLMTNNGFLSPLQGKLSFLLKKDEKAQVQGIIKVDSGQIEMINFEKFKWEINSNIEENVWKLSFQDLKWDSEAPSLESFQQILNIENSSSVVALKNFAVRGKKGENTFEWSDLQAQVVDPKAKISSQGSWDEEGNLKGTVLIKSDRETRSLTVGGTRESPEWN
jgi:hypothetical protein